MPQAQIRELILRIKEEKQMSGVSYDTIVARTETIGSAVSLSSVRRIFAEGSEDKDFRTDSTLMPVARVLLDPDEIRQILTVKKDDNESDLRNIIALKDEMIDMLNNQLTNERENHKEQIEELKQDNKAKVDYLKSYVEKHRRTSIFLVVGLVSVMVFVIAMLIIDGSSPGIGWIS